MAVTPCKTSNKSSLLGSVGSGSMSKTRGGVEGEALALGCWNGVRGITRSEADWKPNLKVFVPGYAPYS